MKLLPWFRFFRLPNLPTAPGDALAGAAVGLMWAAGGDVRRALAADMVIITKTIDSIIRLVRMFIQ